MARSLYDSRPRRSWSKLVSMELNEADKAADMPMPIAMPDKPEFPYGLRICLTDRELEKLGLLDAECQIGDLIDMRCFARVTSMSKDVGEEHSHCRVELQITEIAMESEMEEKIG